MAMSGWSTTAANNASVGSINFSEGQAANTVNDSARQMMADVRTDRDNIEWRDWGHTVTRTGNTTFTISSSTNLTSVYAVGRRIRCTDSSTYYGDITASSYSASTQTVTVAVDGNLSASLSAVALGFDPTNNPIQLANVARPNKIINGAMQIWQRGTSFTTVANGTYLADRWFSGVSTGTGTFNVLQSSDVPTASEAGILANYSLHVDIQTPDTSRGPAEYLLIEQRVEGYNIADLGFGTAGVRHVTVSFWVKSTRTGTFCCSLANSGSSYSYVKEYSIASSNTWEKKVLTFPVATVGAWNVTTGIGCSLRFALEAGSDYQGAADSWNNATDFATSNQVNGWTQNDGVTANDFRITLVKFEGGGSATSFEMPKYDDEIIRCRRYYQNNIIVGAIGYGSAGSNIGAYSPFIPYMRGIPTLTLDGDPSTVSNSNVSTIGVTPEGVSGFFAYRLVVATGSAQFSLNYSASAEL